MFITHVKYFKFDKSSYFISCLDPNTESISSLNLKYYNKNSRS